MKLGTEKSTDARLIVVPAPTLAAAADFSRNLIQKDCLIQKETYTTQYCRSWRRHFHYSSHLAGLTDEICKVIKKTTTSSY